MANSTTEVKTIDTLVEDIYGLFNPSEHVDVRDDLLDKMCNGLRDIIKRKLAKEDEDREVLRFSALGKPDRQLWYAAHPDPNQPPEQISPKGYFKFLYGDVIELLLLFLAEQAGHTVEMEQHEVEVDGVKGHIDAIIDGVLVDVKSASPFGFKKFKENSIVQEDPFGYVSQLSGYANVLTPGTPPAWVAMEKVDGSLCVTSLSQTVVESHPPGERIAELREVLERDTPPPRCYDPVPDGKSGNMKLPTGCSYCAEKFRCHPGLRAFAYSTGPRFLTTVVREPDVPEITR